MTPRRVCEFCGDDHPVDKCERWCFVCGGKHAASTCPKRPRYCVRCAAWHVPGGAPWLAKQCTCVLEAPALEVAHE